MTLAQLRHLPLAFTLIAGSVTAQTSSLVTVQNNGSRSTRVNLVFLSEGYTSSEMGTFATNVQNAVNYLFTREPWNRYQSYCNVYRIQIASNESGTDNGNAGGSRDTYFSTGFNNPDITQSITIGTAGSTRAYSLLNQHVPEYDIPIILVNDRKYGGTGGPLAVLTTNILSPQILEHEVGHSFAKLTDEYDFAFPGFPATEFPNATAKTARADIRWNQWINPSTQIPSFEGDAFNGYSSLVGLYEGANYRAVGWFRPHDNALMRNLDQEPGSVTREAFVLTYYSKVAMIDASTPTAATLTHNAPTTLNFNLTLKSPSLGPALTVQWLVDNVANGQTGATYTTNSRNIGNGTHTVKAIVRDPTPWVRRDPSGFMMEEKTWTLKLSNQTDPAVINNPLPLVRVLPKGSNLFLDATSTGPGTITYQWLKNNVPLKPAVTTPTLSLSALSLANAGTYTARVSNPGHTISHSCKVAVIDTSSFSAKVVVGANRTATLPFAASSNLPPVIWYRAGSGIPLVNGSRYANATTKSLSIKNVTTDDSGDYEFITGDFNRGDRITLFVVTGKTDYTGQAVNLPAGIIGAAYIQPFPAPNNPLLTANSYRALKLPKGLVIHSKTGLITGIPTVASVDQTLGDEVSFTAGNEFGKTTIKVRLLIKPLPPGVQGSFSGPVYVNSALGSTTGGLMSLTINSTGSYTGSALIGSETLNFKGIVRTVTPTDTTASGSIVLKPKHLTSPLSRNFIIDDSLDSDPTTASLTDNYANFQLWRNKWAGPGSVNPYAGYHTFYLTASPNANAPKGHGFGSVSIGTTGRTTATGRLADGSSFSTTSFLTAEGSVFVYQTLYTTVAKGSFIAFLDLDDGSPDFFNAGKSVSNWFRPADPRPITATLGRTFRNGFGLGDNPETPLPIGGLYVPPAKTAIPMELSAATNSPPRNAELSFQHLLGNDPLAVVPDVTLDLKPGSSVKVNAPNNKATTFSINPADGRFKGSYTTSDPDPRPPLAPSTRPRPAIKRKIDYQGIIVRENGIQKGYGFFLRDALPLADGSTAPTTSPRDSGRLELKKTP